ncbi:MAG: hypothetical protein EOP54_13215 [Sphingobacteriales bacterium]|nr:MAG: hypothetical protein EOP54_13215 [Sphingobacteriales bacterium]
MNILKPQDILKQTAHRNSPLPDSDWVVYSEWKNVLMLHWKVDASVIKHLLPPNLSVDTFEGGAWVTMCVASIENFRNKFLNLIKQGFKFKQVLMQTYVIHNGKPGLFVFNQELEKSFSKNLYQRLFKLKQGETDFQREDEGDIHKFFASNETTGFKLGLHYNYGEPIAPSQLEKWLSNRFKYFYEKDNQLFEYAVHHAEWLFRDVTIEKFKTQFNFGGLSINQQPDYIHFSRGVQKLFWPKNLIK